MNIQAFHLLFDLLCVRLGGLHALHFQGGVEIEHRHGIVMEFYFDEGVIVYRFVIPNHLRQTLGRPVQHEEKKPLTADECLALREDLSQMKGFEEAFEASV